MGFDEKYKLYENLNKEELNSLKIRLLKNLNESQLELVNYLKSIRGIDEKTKYLIHEMLEDKEHLDVFQAIIMNKTY